MKKYKKSKLANGLEAVTYENLHSQNVFFSVVVRAGSRYEKDDERGYAHLLEHMILRGTKNRPTAFDVSIVVDRAGALLNAFTSVEAVRVSIQCSRSSKKEMFDLMSDIIRNPLFDAVTLENEKKVVIQELRRGQTEASRKLWLNSIPKIFSNHPIAHQDIGDEASIMSATPEKLRKYYNSFFTSNNIGVFGVGAITHQEILELAENIGKVGNRGLGIKKLANPVIKNGVFFTPLSNYKQTLLNVIFSRKKILLKESLAVDIIANFLSYGHTSLLYQELRHKAGLIYSLNIYKSQYQDAFIFYITTITSNPKQVIKILFKILFSLKEYLSKRVFLSAKKQYANFLMRSLDGDERILESLIRYWITYGELVHIELLLKILKELTYGDIVKVINSLITKRNLSVGILSDKDPGIALPS